MRTHGQNIDVGKTEGIVIGIGILVVIGLAVALLTGGAGPDDDEPRINSSTVSNGQAEKTPEGVRISTGDYHESIGLVGAYAGHGFVQAYPNNQTDPVRMRITPDIQPSDGVLDAWIVGEIVNASDDPVFRAHVFVDDDFRDAVPDAMLAWGPNFTDNTRAYRYEEWEPGIYRDTVVDTNVSRFRLRGPDSEGEANVAVGNFSVADIGDETAVTEQGITLVTAR